MGVKMEKTMIEKKKVRLLPHSKEAEMLVLGSALVSTANSNVVAQNLEEGDFYFPEHRLIFSAIKNGYRQDKPADVLLISEELKRQEKLEEAGGLNNLTLLAQYAGTSVYIEEYVQIVKDKAILRKIISTAQTVEQKALVEPEDPTVCLDEAQQLFFQIGQSHFSKVGVTVADIVAGLESRSKMPLLKELEMRQERYLQKGSIDGGITGIATHFVDLDKITNGLNNSHFIILAARPAMGKTALAINIAENVCLKNNIPVGIFSLEMTAEQLVQRMIASKSEVESDKIRTGSLDPTEFQRVVEAVNEMKSHQMVIDDTPGLKVTDLRARARRMKESYGIGLLVVDYLQLLSGSGSIQNQESRQNEISEISRMLKNLARELDIPILCIAQLSRKVEERTGHRPLMSDLRESGSIEQDADIVLLLLRREYYDPNDRPGQAQLFVAKNRHGSIGDVLLTYRKELAQFANYATQARAKEYQPEEAGVY